MVNLKKLDQQAIFFNEQINLYRLDHNLIFLNFLNLIFYIYF